MYLLDSDVLIDAKNRYYAFDIVPAYWDWLERAHKAQSVFTIEKVAQEILAGGDQLAEWMDEQPKSFKLASTQKDADNMRKLSQWANNAHYNQNSVSTFLAAADYYLVAQAASLGYTVVTHERSQPLSGKVKIPDACAAVGVTCMTPFEMLRAEKARFKLHKNK